MWRPLGVTPQYKWRPLVLLAALCCSLSLSHDVTISILVVVDEADGDAAASLQIALQHVNQTQGLRHNYVLRVLRTRDNESFAAMETACQMLPEGADVILDLSTRYVTATMRSLAEAMGITHVAVVDPVYYEWLYSQYTVSVNLAPPAGRMLPVFQSIARTENLTNVGVIYQQPFDLDDKPKRLLRNLPTQHLYLRGAVTADEMLLQLQSVRDAGLQHLFLAGSSSWAAHYLSVAESRGMLSFKYSWYLLSQDGYVGCSACRSQFSLLHITGRPLPAHHEPYMQLLRQQHLLPQMTHVFHYDVVSLLTDVVDRLVTANTWPAVNFTDCVTFTSRQPVAMTRALLLKRQLQQSRYEGMYGPLVWEGDVANQDLTLDLTQVKLDNGTVTASNQVGHWSADEDLVVLGDSLLHATSLRYFRVVTVKEPPFIFRNTTRPPPEVKHYRSPDTGLYYYGYCIDLMYNISEALNFRWSLYESPDGAYGTVDGQGHWNGMVRELMDDRADIALAPLSVMAEREHVVDFTVPYYDLVGITILMKKPEFQYSVFKFMSVLEDAVWGCIFSAFIIVAVLLAVFDRFSPYSYQNTREDWDGQGEKPRIFTLKEGLWFCMTSLTPQGGGEAPRALSGRLVAATWWMFGFIMVATYTANLAAFLTVSRLEQPIESLDDLAKQFKTNYAPQQSTATETYFQRMADIEDKFYVMWKEMSLDHTLNPVERSQIAVWDYPVSNKFTNLWAAMHQTSFPRTMDEAVQRIKQPEPGIDNFVFIGDATQNKYATLRDCDLWEVGQEFSRKPLALAVQQGAPLKRELSSVILRLLNQRVLEQLKSFWWQHERAHCPLAGSESDGISIYNIGGVFVVIFIGVGLGVLTLLFELYWHSMRPRGAAQQRHVTASSAAIGSCDVGVRECDARGFDCVDDAFAQLSRDVT